ncbi:MAG: hypothetical protein AAFV53_24715 [Myxococcota bacterium]
MWLFIMLACRSPSDDERPDPGDEVVDTGGLETALKVADFYDCDTDTVNLDAPSGVMETPPLGEIAGLCDGQVVAGTLDDPAFIWLDVISQQILNRWPVQAAPNVVALDVSGGALFGGGSRMDLETEAVDPASGLTDDLTGLVLGTDGELLALRPGDLDIVARADGRLVRSIATGAAGTLLAADPDQQRVFIAERGETRPRISRLTITDDDILDQKQLINVEGCANGQSMTLSPDGTQLVFVCAGDDLIIDRSSEDLLEEQGRWGAGAVPRAAAFNPDGSVMASINATQLHVFDAKTYRRQALATLPECDFPDYRQVGFSRGGDLIWAYSACGFDQDSGIVAWFSLPELLAASPEE